MKVNIGVLNYNGRALLEECLPSIIRAKENSKNDVTVTVIDNCSTDDSVNFLKEKFNDVVIYEAPENKVYCSYNQFFRDIDDDIVFILNSDIKVDENFIDPAVQHFEQNPDVFFVSSLMYYFDGVTYQGDKSKAVINFGVISADTRFDGYESGILEGGYAFSTGNGAFSREKFIKLYGFDEIFLPGRYEDVDFCYRGWKSGYKGIYEPKSIIYHKGYASFKEEFTSSEIHGTVFRNSLLFTCKNITNIGILFNFFLFLFPRLLYFVLTGRLYFVKGFYQALLRFSACMKSKKRDRKTFIFSDKKTMELVG